MFKAAPDEMEKILADKITGDRETINPIDLDSCKINGFSTTKQEIENTFNWPA